MGNGVLFSHNLLSTGFWFFGCFLFFVFLVENLQLCNFLFICLVQYFSLLSLPSPPPLLCFVLDIDFNFVCLGVSPTYMHCVLALPLEARRVQLPGTGVCSAANLSALEEQPDLLSAELPASQAPSLSALLDTSADGLLMESVLFLLSPHNH